MKLNKYFQKISHTKNSNLFTYYFLAALRVVLVLIPQVGYIHPDEFFQSMEIMEGDAFDLEVTKTWEFDRSNPIRSIVIPYLLIKIPMSWMKIFCIYFNYYLGIDLRTSYILLVVPRLIMCAISFLNDYSLYRICLSYGIQYEIRLIALASSFVMLVFGTRTFSNTIEMALCSLLLFYVSECMIRSNTVIYQTEIIQKNFHEAKTTVERVRFLKMKFALPGHSFTNCIIISTICVAGVFNRPTFICFGFSTVFFWLHRGMGSTVVTFLDFNLRMAYFLLSCIPALLAFTFIDSLYYGYLTEIEIDFFDIGIKNFVFTPWNFVKYNLNSSNTAEHGLHPRYLHFLINIPLLYNILGVITICSMLFMIYRFLRGNYSSLPRAQSIISLMSAAIFVPTVALSIINHQEPRFLLPITLPIILLHAPKLKLGFSSKNPFKNRNCLSNFIYNNILSKSASSYYLLNLWFTINILFTLFFGFLHQGGVYQLSEHFSRLTQAKGNDVHIHLVTSHIYSMPQSFVLLPSTTILHVNPENGQKYRRNKLFHLYEYGSSEMNVLYSKVKLILDNCQMKYISKKQKYQLYLAIPSSLSEELNLAFYNSNSTIMQHNLVKVFYPHLSTEAMPRLFIQHPCEVNTDVYEIDDTCSVHDDTQDDPYSVSFMLRQFSSVIHQFGLILYRIEIIKKI